MPEHLDLASAVAYNKQPVRPQNAPPRMLPHGPTIRARLPSSRNSSRNSIRPAPSRPVRPAFSRPNSRPVQSRPNSSRPAPSRPAQARTSRSRKTCAGVLHVMGVVERRPDLWQMTSCCTTKSYVMQAARRHGVLSYEADFAMTSFRVSLRSGVPSSGDHVVREALDQLYNAALAFKPDRLVFNEDPATGILTSIDASWARPQSQRQQYPQQPQQQQHFTQQFTQLHQQQRKHDERVDQKARDREAAKYERMIMIEQKAQERDAARRDRLGGKRRLFWGGEPNGS